MKYALVTILLLCSIPSLNAQFAENHALYLTSELNLGNYIGVDVNLNFLYKEKYSFKMGYSGNTKTPETLPDNFDPGLLGFLSSDRPKDRIENFQATMGKVFYLNQAGTIRLNMMLGAGYTLLRAASDWERSSGGGFLLYLGPNYSWTYFYDQTWSFIINPKIEFPFTWIAGFSVSPTVQLNEKSSFYGIGLGYMLGLLKRRIPNE